MEISMTPSNVELKTQKPDQNPNSGLGMGGESRSPNPVEASSVAKPIDNVTFTSENRELLDSLNSQMASLNMGVAFSIDESTRSSIVKVIDRSTSEVVKQYPNDEALKVMQNIQAFLDSASARQMSEGSSLTGALFNEII